MERRRFSEIIIIVIIIVFGGRERLHGDKQQRESVCVLFVFAFEFGLVMGLIYNGRGG